MMYLSRFFYSLIIFSFSGWLLARNNLVILQYHHVADNTPAITSVSPATFAEHMQYLSEQHTVLALDEALMLLRTEQALPDKAVAITFDDGYANIMQNADPILQKFGFPYTVFINPSEIGQMRSQLDWDEVKTMSENGVIFANHTLDHAHLLQRYANESDTKWLKRVSQDITMAEALLNEKLGYSKKWLAYPFGEYNLTLQNQLRKLGFIGFGQQSGAVASFSDFTALPRFPASGRYAKLSTLKTKLNSLAMLVVSKQPTDTLVEVMQAIGKVELQVTPDDLNMNAFACYFEGNKLELQRQQNTFTMQIDQPTYPGRTRINCTAPSLSQAQRFYWYSMPFFTATEDGDWLD